VKESRIADLQQRKTFEIRAEWDGEAGVWWCLDNELPLSTEAPTFEQLVARVLEIAPEIAAENGLAARRRDRGERHRGTRTICIGGGRGVNARP
jgi:hypothetical protein